MIYAVVGINWGDEGKGRVVDYFAQKYEVGAVVRYQGGCNAGHTVENDLGTFKLHLIPSGIFTPSVTNVLGSGMVIDLEALNIEIAGLQDRGIPCDNMVISDRAMISFPFSRLEDEWEEERLGKAAFGSTRRGIAYAYADRCSKKGIMIGELLEWESFKQRLRQLVDFKRLVAAGIYGQPNAIHFDQVLDWANTQAEKLRHLIRNTTTVLESVIASKQDIIFEAQLGALRDLNHGIYPFTSSSCTLASFAPIGSGLFSRKIKAVYGVMKAFSTCVGAGPFVTEMDTADADRLRGTANEFGTATGRPRRIGHFDAVASKYGAYLQGTTEVVITKLDCLSGQNELLICVAYEIDGQQIPSFPLTAALERARPVYITMPGWSEDITNIRRFKDLPRAAREYVLKIEKLIGRKIRYVSVGPHRDAIIDCNK